MQTGKHALVEKPTGLIGCGNVGARLLPLLKPFGGRILTAVVATLPLLAVTGAEAELAKGALAQLHAGHEVRACIAKAPSGKVMLLVDERPEPLFWANLTDGQDPNYRRAGFNTVFAELSCPGRDKPIGEAFKEWDELLLRIKNHGLYVIIYIHNSVHGGAGETPWSFDKSWRKYVQAIVKRYRGVTNLVGWVFSDEAGDHITYTHEAFRAFLKDEYKTIEALNAAWRSAYTDFDQIRLEYQREGHGRPEDGMVTAGFPFGIGPKAFDSARFKLAHTSWAHRQFEATIREVDPATPIWGGAYNQAWPATQVPTTWGAFFDFYPENSGDDFDTHHVWMVDVGRGPNIRPAMPMLLPEHSDRFDWHPDARVIRGWMVESAIHGAASITFWPWSFLGLDDRPGDRSTSTERVDMCGMTIRTLKTSGIFEMLPQPTIAVIYQPYAEGWGNVSQVYGLLRYPTGEPLMLMQELKYGTRYGQVDYLTTSYLDHANLDDYGVILAPFAADVTKQHLEKLRDYVRNGGVLLADVGFGCIQGGKVVTGMSDEATQFFGIKSVKVSTAEPGSWVATGEFGELLGGLLKDVDATEKFYQMALDVEPATAVAALRGPGGQGLYVNRVGKGFALFCSALAWSSPTVTDSLARQIHNALFSRRAKIECLGEEDWSAVSAQPYFTQGYEIARFAQGYAVQNRSDVRMTIKVGIDGRMAEHTLSHRSVILVKPNETIPIGSGVWPAERGPKQ